MSRKLDLSNQKFGRWTVLYESPIKKNRNTYWHCKCECGNEKDVRGADLRNGASQSCGCLQKERAANNNTKDLTNKIFGKLTVLEKTERRRQGSIIWKCQCSCGKICEVCSVELIKGDTQSCGCLQKERIKEACSCKLQGKKFGKLLVLEESDKEHKIKYSKDITWKCLCDCGNIHYALTSSLNSGNVQSCGCVKSKGENKIKQLLIDNNILFETQKSFSDCRDINPLLFDFYINNSYLIEYDGSQHFDKTNSWYDSSLEKRDNIKNQYSIKNNIPLIRIPYWKYDTLTIEDLLLNSTTFLVKE